MKSIYIIITVLTLSLFSSHAQTTQEQLVGTWTFNYQESLDNMNADSKTAFNKIPSPLKQKIEANYKKRKITFNSDGSYQQVLVNGYAITGVWTLRNKNIIEITDGKGNLNKQKIEELTDTRLILKPQDVGMGKSTIKQWYFTKN